MQSLLQSTLDFVSSSLPGWVPTPTVTTVLVGAAFVVPMCIDLPYLVTSSKHMIQAIWSHRKIVKRLSKDEYRTTCRKFLSGDDAVTYTSKVSLFDLDHFGHMNNGKYFGYCDFARIHLYMECGLFPSGWKLGTPLVGAGMSIRYRKELKWGQRFTVEGRVVGWDEVSMFNEMRFVTFRRKKDPATGKMVAEKVLHATVVMRSQLMKKGKMRAVLDNMGLNDLPDVHMPHEDVAAWAASLQQSGVRVKAAMEKE